MFSNYYIKFKDFERWLQKKIDKFFNPISAIIEHQEKDSRVYQRSSERENKSIHRTVGTLRAFDNQANNIHCRRCSKNLKISECTQLILLPVDNHLKFVKENRLCFNYLSNLHKIKECKSKVCCRIDSHTKR